MTKKYVYFMRPVGMVGPIKIGRSAKPPERLLKLSVWSPFPLEFIGSFPGWADEETYLHSRFADQHSHREWFHSSDLLLRTIDRILSGETLEAACAGIPVARNACRPRTSGGRLPMRYGPRAPDRKNRRRVKRRGIQFVQATPDECAPAVETSPPKPATAGAAIQERIPCC